ncbi:MAG: hypothetical protein C4524_15215 [Candidatus Zixiibacteriota bacterium]|nr:MAG: hypothetical protein C4524_15215 [candidate division Zixibacteria bacterium]
MSELLPLGSPAPDFTLEGVGPEGLLQVRLRDYRGRRHVLLVFYPGDNTPG